MVLTNTFHVMDLMPCIHNDIPSNGRAIVRSIKDVKKQRYYENPVVKNSQIEGAFKEQKERSAC